MPAPKAICRFGRRPRSSRSGCSFAAGSKLAAVNKAMIYYYFSSKDAIYDVVNVDEIRRLRAIAKDRQRLVLERCNNAARHQLLSLARLEGVQVIDDHEVRRVAELEVLIARLEIQASVPGALVSVDGARLGTTPLEPSSIEINPGEHDHLGIRFFLQYPGRGVRHSLIPQYL